MISILSRRLLRNITAEVLVVRTAGVLAAAVKPREPLTLRNVEIVVDPNEELIDQFMEGYGKQRLNFRRSDLAMWKKCFRDDYRLYFVVDRNTKTIISTRHTFSFHPVSPHSDTIHQYNGFFWIHPDYRGVEAMRITENSIKTNMKGVSDNVVSHCFPSSMNLWIKMFGHWKYGHIQSVSYYQMDEMKVPQDLNTDGIFIKNTLDVPDEDIVAYDRTVFPYERSEYVLTLLRSENGFGKVAYDSTGKVIGFGTVIIYPSGECVLSPLYADDQRVAQAIFKSILEQIPLDDKKLLRFHVRSVDKCEGGFEWISPFLKCQPRKELAAYLTYTTHLPTIHYEKVFVNFPYTNCPV